MHTLPALLETYLDTLAAETPTLAERMRAGYEAAALRPVTLRVNSLKTTRDAVCQALAAADIAYEQVGWYDDALLLPTATEHDVWQLPIYQQGEIYLQSLSSMLPPLVLDAQPGADVLDMCAAPGGKTSELAQLTHNQAHLTACEMKPSCADKLAYNLEKLGVTNVNIMRTDARRLDELFSFDYILLDAPCTGSGTICAGDDRALKHVTPELLRKTTRSQTALLDRALTVLKPGGTLVYSTCSILPEENDQQVARALKRHRDCELVELAPDTFGAGDIPVLPASDIPTNLAEAYLPGTLTVLPTKLYEGFYLAKIKKTAGGTAGKHAGKKRR